MAVLVGANGSRGDWLAVRLDTATGRITAEVLSTAALPSLGERAADRLARKFVGPRRSSVFPSPVLPALRCPTRAEAAAVTKQTDGRGVGAQAFGLYAKIYAVRDLVLATGKIAQRTFEVHPEVSFTAWRGQPMQHHKKHPDGKEERLALIARDFGASVLDQLHTSSRRRLPDDDVADAFAALWTADRLARGVAVRLPDELVSDSTGIPMNIWY